MRGFKKKIKKSDLCIYRKMRSFSEVVYCVSLDRYIQEHTSKLKSIYSIVDNVILRFVERDAKETCLGLSPVNFFWCFDCICIQGPMQATDGVLLDSELLFNSPPF